MFSLKKKSFKLISNLLDEVENNILKYQNRGMSCLLKPKNEGDRADTDTRFHKS